MVFFVALNLIAVFIFTKMKKELHILEIIVYWMVGSYVFQNFSAICYMNFKTLLIPERLSYEFTHVLNRLVLFPLLMVAFLHFFLVVHTRLKKLLLAISFLFLFVGLEWFADFLGIIDHVQWRMWWSFSFWTAALLLLIGCMKRFRKILYQGGLDL